MCGKRLKVFLVSLGLVLLSSVPPLSLYCYAEVRLTDEEVSEILNEIQLSKQELTELKTELEESKKESQKLKTELNNVKSTYIEQKKSYEMQLEEAEKKNQTLKTCLTVTATTSVILAVLSVALFL